MLLGYLGGSDYAKGSGAVGIHLCVGCFLVPQHNYSGGCTHFDEPCGAAVQVYFHNIRSGKGLIGGGCGH